jgi:formyl-CoA transferase/CoA:oxalate CoA-transferase
MGPLEGVLVIEAGLLIQGPQAAALLADWGADVIKIEYPGWGDQARWMPVGPDTTRSAFFEAMNRGKRSVTLDLRTPAGRDVFLRLAERADVVISNFTPGVMEEWGVGHEALSVRNPRLIYAAGSTYGIEGPDALRSGADLSAQASGGIMTMTGADPGRPVPIGSPMADHIAAQNLAAGVLAALYARERTGRGQRVDTSLLGGQIWAQAAELTHYLITGRVAPHAGQGHGLVPGVYGVFPTADGWIAIVGVAGKARARFFELIGRPDLYEAYPQPLYSPDEKAKLFPLLEEALAKKTTAEWAVPLELAGVRFAPVRGHAELVADPSVRANRYLIDIDGTTVVASPVAFSDTPIEPTCLAPELGQDTELVLLDLGYDWDEITALRESGIL